MRVTDGIRARDETGAVDVRRACDRFATTADGLTSRHSFSFGRHYDPANTHFGLLMAVNEEQVRAGAGFDMHPHRETDIVTWVLSGTLRHTDSAGHTATVGPGVVAATRSGTGIRHAERNASDTDDVVFVQMWVLPGEPGGEPGYEQRDIGVELDRGELLVVASGMPKHATERVVPIGNEHAALHAARLPAGGTATIPTAPLVHVYVARGSVHLDGAGDLGTGDAARITGGEGQRMRAAASGAEILVWEMHASLGGVPSSR